MVYVGSKERLAKYIVPILQDYIDKNNIKLYIEPFVGGANIIDKIKCQRKIGCDAHEGLIKIYKSVQKGWIPPLTITEEEYNNAHIGKIEEPLKSYIGFSGSYASKYFGGFARGFKIDGITPRDIYNERTRRFIKQIPKLQDIEFYCLDYKNIKSKRERERERTLIYCDPPYENTTKYTVKGFIHEEFWGWVREMSEKHIVITSEFNSPQDFISVWERKRTCSLDKDTGSISKTEHLFIKDDNGIIKTNK